MSTPTPPIDPTDPVLAFAALMGQLGALSYTPEVRAHLGEGLARDMSYFLAAYRQRFPAPPPGVQPDLFVSHASLP